MISVRSLLQKTQAYIFGANGSRARSLGNVGKEYVFVHIPKNAGSSIAEALEIDKSWHYTAQAYRQMLGRPAYKWRFSFAFVRNPWNRFLSLYRYARLEESLYHSAIDPESAPYGKHEDYDLLQDASVEECAHYLQEGRLKHDDFINHWRPQSDWVTDDGGEIILDFIGQVETIDEDFQTVARQIDLSDGSLPVVNTSDGAPSSREYRSAFTEAARRIVAEYYHEDIERWGYTF